jgi:hypothetical protein
MRLTRNGYPVRLSGIAPGIAARPVKYPGRRLSGVATDGATDAQEIDVPAHDEQRVRYSHCISITCNEPECPVNVRHVDSGCDIRGHERGNMRVVAAIPASYNPPPARDGRGGISPAGPS